MRLLDHWDEPTPELPCCVFCGAWGSAANVGDDGLCAACHESEQEVE